MMRDNMWNMKNKNCLTRQMGLILGVLFCAVAAMLVSSQRAQAVSAKPMIFIGDSRGEGLRLSISEEQKKKVTFYTGVSQGYQWLADEIVPQVNTQLYSHPKKKYKIVINLGINDFSYNMSNYAQKFNSLAKNEWAEYEIFVMGVTPVDNAKMLATCKYPKRNQDIAKANKYLREHLDRNCKNLHFVGLFKRMRNGEAMAAGYETGYDGAHYTSDTYLKIWDILSERITNVMKRKKAGKI